MCLGLLALKNLRVNQIPDVEQPVIVVRIPYPGASPETVEREIVNRVEKALQSIPQVYQIRSTAAESNATIVIIFNFKKNMVEASDEIRNAIASVRHKLPVEMREPILQRIDPSAQPIMQMALSSSAQSHAEISRLAEDVLADRFRGIDGVAVVNVNGALRRELSVLLRAEKLREYNVSVTDVVNALRAQNTTAPVGRVKGPLDEQSIRLVGRIESPAEFEQIVLKRRGDEMVRLGQVASGRGRLRRARGLQPAQRQPERRHLGHALARREHRVVAAEVRKLVAEINKTLPPGTKLEVTQDGGEDAEASLQERDRGAGLRRGAHDLRGLRVPQLLALHADHGAVAADLGDRRLHRRVGLRLHAQLHDAAGPVAGHRRADRRRHRGAREHRAAHGARRGPRDRRARRAPPRSGWP